MNRWKNVGWMAAGVAAVIVAGTFTAKPLLAQIKAAFVQNVDEPGRSPYFSTVNLGPTICFNDRCVAQFAPVPAGKRLIATNLTGRINVAAPGVITSLVLFADSPVRIPTTLLAGMTRDAGNMIGISSTLLTFVSAGQRPLIEIEATTAIGQDQYALTLSGYLVDCSSSPSCAAIVQ